MNYDQNTARPWWKLVASTFINLMLLQTCIPEGRPMVMTLEPGVTTPTPWSCGPSIGDKLLMWCSDGRKVGLPAGVRWCDCIFDP